MRILSFAIILLSVLLSGFGQDITKPEADSLSVAFHKATTDMQRADILFRLAQYQIFKPGEFKADLDSAENYLNKAAQLTVNLKSPDADGFQIFLRSCLARERGQQQAAREMAQKAVQLLEAATNNSYRALAYSELASYFDSNDPEQIPAKIRLLDSAAELYRQSGDIQRQADCLENEADLYQTMYENPKALQKLDLSLKAYKSIGYKPLQMVYLLYGAVYQALGDGPKALEYDYLALKTAEEQKDTSMTLCEINNCIGTNLEYIKEGEKALPYYRSALRVAEKYNDYGNMSVVVLNLASDLQRLHKPLEALNLMNSLPKQFLEPKSLPSKFNVLYTYLSIYYDLQDNRQFEFYAEELKNQMKIFKPAVYQASKFNVILVKYYIRSGQNAAAAFWLRKEDSLGAKMGEPITTVGNYFLRFRLDTALGNYKLSVKDLLKYLKLNDSIFNQTSKKQISQLEVEFQTKEDEQQLEVKNKDIMLLNQQNQLQQGNLRQANLLRNFTIGGIMLVLIIAGLLYQQNRLKQKSNDVITQKNHQLQHLVTEKEWLLKEVHHRVKNNLQVMMSLQELQVRNLTSTEALTAVHDSSNRLYAMSLIHQKLYQQDGLARIDMRQYIGELVRYLTDAFSPGKTVKVETDLQSDIELSVSQAIPVGLILNEAITNTFKYAFANRSAGEADPRLRIGLCRKGQGGEIELLIADNGRGYDAKQDKTRKKSLGFSLMEALADELDGELSIVNENGVTLILRFIPIEAGRILRFAPALA
jgi:two-component sensor histidine kinase